MPENSLFDDSLFDDSLLANQKAERKKKRASTASKKVVSAASKKDAEPDLLAVLSEKDQEEKAAEKSAPAKPRAKKTAPRKTAGATAKKSNTARGTSKKKATKSKSPTSTAKAEAKKNALAAKAQHARENLLENEPLKTVIHPKTAQAVKTHLGLETIGDALEYYPRKYLPRGELTSFSELVEGQDATIIARVMSVNTRTMKSRYGKITEVVITDHLADESSIAGQHQVVQGRADYRYSGASGTPRNGGNPRLMGSASGYSDSYGLPQQPPQYSGFDMGDVFGGFAQPAFAQVGSSTMTLSFFNAWTAAREIHAGDHVMFSGKVGSYRGELTLTNPHYAVLQEYSGGLTDEGKDAIENAKAHANAPIPVYRANTSFTTDRVATLIEQVLERVSLDELEDPVPYTVRKARKIPSLAWTYRAIHTPDTEETWRAALHFLRYREAFILQSALARIKAARAAQESIARPAVAGGYADRLLELLPYELTDGQKKVGEDITADLGSSVAMNRLLQGDVGSGKTVVALRALLQCVDNGAQTAMLAPTEVLAEQHYRSVLEILGDLAITADDVERAGAKPDGGVLVLLLKASLGAKAKRQAHALIASGEADIVIGTHALLSKAVQFVDLGMVVVDEQHRFGVEQRDALRGAGGEVPHRLVMTATPIPRTVAMTVFGDLDVSVLDQLPAGRQKIQTHVVPLTEHPKWGERLWQRAREEVDSGHQVYVVVPKIGESDSAEEDFSLLGSMVASKESASGGELNSVASMIEELAGNPVLAGVRIEALHGKMDTAEKADVMTRYSRGEIDLLVCTTVIEVGVNVPNATLMIIMDADRFGISGLHQLRGRIGRGNLPGTCLLVTTQDSDGVSRERLNAVASTTDGFELSRVDLEQRREGDILGAAQSGKKSTLKLLRALTDAKLIERARIDAQSVIEKDPTLAKHPDLARAIERELDAESEAFLNRG